MARSFFGFLRDMFTAKCICGAKATEFPHGIPCCEEHACEVECLSWLGDACDCGKNPE